MTINTPIIWVFLPILIGIITAVLFQRQILSVILTCVTGFGLSALALFFPEELIIAIGPLTLTFVESLGILGRQLSVSYQLLPFIGFIFFATGLWGLGSAVTNAPDTFRPISLVISALMTAALGVRPFLYAALFIEAAVLFSIPMLSPFREKTHPGILRYLSLQTLAMPFILLAGWLLSGVETLPPDSPIIGQTMLVLGLGLGLWLAVFPFHSWVPMVSERAHPISLSFLLFIFPTAISLFSLNFLDRYTFLRTSQNLFEALRIVGVLMIVFGGLWTAYQENVKRAFGFSTLTETGFMLLAVGLRDQGGLNLLLMLYPARAIGFWLWGYTLSLIETRADSLTFDGLRGFSHRYPIISTGLLISQLSIAGLPLFASFPVKIALLSTGFSSSVLLGSWVFIGNLGLFFFTLRLLLTLVAPDEGHGVKKWDVIEKARIYLPILLIAIAIIFIGLFPNLALTEITTTLTAFSQLQ